MKGWDPDSEIGIRTNRQGLLQAIWDVLLILKKSDFTADDALRVSQRIEDGGVYVVGLVAFAELVYYEELGRLEEPGRLAEVELPTYASILQESWSTWTENLGNRWFDERSQGVEETTLLLPTQYMRQVETMQQVQGILDHMEIMMKHTNTVELIIKGLRQQLERVATLTFDLNGKMASLEERHKAQGRSSSRRRDDLRGEPGL